MPWIIRRTDQGGGFVMPSGSAKSYTSKREKARRYPSRDEALADLCVENEVVELIPR